MNLLRVAIVSLSSITEFVGFISNVSATATCQRRADRKSRNQCAAQYLTMVLQLFVHQRDLLRGLTTGIDVAPVRLECAGQFRERVEILAFAVGDPTLEGPHLSTELVGVNLTVRAWHVRGA